MQAPANEERSGHGSRLHAHLNKTGSWIPHGLGRLQLFSHEVEAFGDAVLHSITM